MMQASVHTDQQRSVFFHLTKCIHHPTQAAYKKLTVSKGGRGPNFSGRRAPGGTARLHIERVEVAITGANIDPVVCHNRCCQDLRSCRKTPDWFATLGINA